jgi:hypothetical protein
MIVFEAWNVPQEPFAGCALYGPLPLDSIIRGCPVRGTWRSASLGVRACTPQVVQRWRRSYSNSGRCTGPSTISLKPVEARVEYSQPAITDNCDDPCRRMVASGALDTGLLFPAGCVSRLRFRSPRV